MSSSTVPPPFVPVHDSEEFLATELLPLTSATLTIRIIKSFPFRTTKNLVLKDVDLTTMTVGQLMDKCREAVHSQVGFKLYRQVQLDTLKKYTVAHGHKTQNLIINLDHDEWILSDMAQTLVAVGCENETELSLFNRAAYDEFKAHPETKWD
ncbi:uncharacterized protein EHS24_006235 [Apiotrichum porosum]|uniref:Uncharacterized protein n=1 Tax=Apiotrichum porosum TaxID=105984 RepID=A0A427Y0U1_9TREE|nr:uncharacterized protein EHS24_006235 [Apiotrichum porosum]RSH84711.1 hypothetical protein EHS24_006235 [Apiotrichum porosum]